MFSLYIFEKRHSIARYNFEEEKMEQIQHLELALFNDYD